MAKRIPESSLEIDRKKKNQFGQSGEWWINTVPKIAREKRRKTKMFPLAVICLTRARLGKHSAERACKKKCYIWCAPQHKQRKLQIVMSINKRTRTEKPCWGGRGFRVKLACNRRWQISSFLSKVWPVGVRDDTSAATFLEVRERQQNASLPTCRSSLRHSSRLRCGDAQPHSPRHRLTLTKQKLELRSKLSPISPAPPPNFVPWLAPKELIDYIQVLQHSQHNSVKSTRDEKKSCRGV